MIGTRHMIKGSSAKSRKIEGASSRTTRGATISLTCFKRPLITGARRDLRKSELL